MAQGACTHFMNEWSLRVLLPSLNGARSAQGNMNRDPVMWLSGESCLQRKSPTLQWMEVLLGAKEPFIFEEEIREKESELPFQADPSRNSNCNWLLTCNRPVTIPL